MNLILLSDFGYSIGLKDLKAKKQSDIYLGHCPALSGSIYQNQRKQSGF